MKRKIKKIMVALFAVIIIFSGLIGNKLIVRAEVGRAVPVIEYDKLNTDEMLLTPGSERKVMVPVRAVGGYMNNVGITVTPDKGAPFTIAKVELTKRDDRTDVLGISETGIYIGFTVKVKETAAIGYYPITITIKAIDADAVEYTSTLSIDAQILKEKSPSLLTLSMVEAKDAMIGSNTSISFMVKNEGEITARNAYVSLDFSKCNISPKYETPKVKIGDLEPGEEQYMTFPVNVLSTETVGLKTITANLTYKNVDGKELNESYGIYIKVIKNNKIPIISFDTITYDKALKPGNKVYMMITILNDGDVNAENIKIKLDDTSTGLGSEGVVKNYYAEIIPVRDINSGDEVKIKIPFTISKQATGGLKKLSFAISYTDEYGTAYTSTALVYPEVISSTVSSTTKANIIISNVKQYPLKPQAGGKLNITFEVENKGTLDISELKFTLDGLTGTTFIPESSKPYIYIDELKAGKKKKVSIPLSVSDSIPEGLNNLTIKYAYLCDGTSGNDSFVIPVCDVQNSLGSKSKPKIIVSKYTTNSEELRAGSSFKLTFELKNTHSSTTAKNITVTVSQADNVFTVLQGSNSFFISKIGAGETIQETLEMKVKSDATTKAYPIKVVIEYDYDGAIANPETGEVGITKTEELNLQAVEDSRPVIDNINVYSWDGKVTVGNPATLHFEFYNMGKSSLNNVTAYVEGDFAKSDGSMYFVGNVAAGAPAYAEYDIIPNIEGTAKGKLRVTFEDSNGDQKEITKDFEAVIQPASTAAAPDMGPTDSKEVMSQNLPGVKKAILPMWLFILIEFIIFIIFIPITKKIIISRYKSKLRKKDQQEY